MLVVLLADMIMAHFAIVIIGPCSAAIAVLLDRFGVLAASAVVFWLVGFLYQDSRLIPGMLQGFSFFAHLTGTLSLSLWLTQEKPMGSHYSN